MMTVLKPIAFDVVVCMSQLFDYYLYSVSVSLVSSQLLFLWFLTKVLLKCMASSLANNSRKENFLKGFYDGPIG